jgi:hypothetical protein
MTTRTASTAQTSATIATLEQQLADLAADWRASDQVGRTRLTVQYAQTLDALYAQGWDDLIDSESMLPDVEMPPQYFTRHPEARASDWSVSLSRPLGRRARD